MPGCSLPKMGYPRRIADRTWQIIDMQMTLAFDVYGTLIDTNGVVSKLQSLVGDRAKDFSSTWREKQLEYSFRRGLMKNYENFAVCTEQALDYTCSCYRTPLSKKQKKELLEQYQKLPAYGDVKSSLEQLQGRGYRLYAFSNGSAEAVETLLSTAGIRGFFLEVVSVDDLGTFKPDPAVYHHFLVKSGATKDDAWLISSNAFDVIGALSAGIRAVWLQRSRGTVFDPWGMKPTRTIQNLNELEECL